MGSSLQNSQFLRRLWSLSAPGTPRLQDVANVNLVNDRSGIVSSRELCPYARDVRGHASAGAGEHNYIEITSLRGGSGGSLEHICTHMLAQTASGTGTVALFITATGSLTTVSRTQVTPLSVDTDPEITPVMFVGAITTANLPAQRQTVVPINALGSTNATPLFANLISHLPPAETTRFALRWEGARSLFVFVETAATAANIDVGWHGVK